MREYRSIEFWWSEHPGVRALILQHPGGPSFLLKKTDQFARSRVGYALLGVIE